MADAEGQLDEQTKANTAANSAAGTAMRESALSAVGSGRRGLADIIRCP